MSGSVQISEATSNFYTDFTLTLQSQGDIDVGYELIISFPETFDFYLGQTFDKNADQMLDY